MKNKKSRIAFPHHMWTKQELVQLYELWDECTPEELAKKMRLRVSQIKNIATQMRASGFPLLKKRRNGYVRILLEDLKKELKII